MRKVDDLGRVVIPMEIREQLHLIQGTPMDFTVKNGCVIMKPMDRRCHCCNKESDKLLKVGNVQLCKSCIEQFASLAQNQ